MALKMTFTGDVDIAPIDPFVSTLTRSSWSRRRGTARRRM